MADNFTAEELAAFTPEQRAEIERIEQSVRDFLADSRAIRYVESDANRDALLNFLADHGLEVSHANMLFGYNRLCAECALELVPIAPVVERPPAPTPTQPPAPIPTAPDPRAPQMFRNGRAIPYENPNRSTGSYKWAEEQGISDGEVCDRAGERSNSPSFAEGCHVYVDGEPDPEAAADQ